MRHGDPSEREQRQGSPERPGFAHVLVPTGTYSVSLQFCCPDRQHRSEACRKPKGDTALRSPPATRNLGTPRGARKAHRGASPGWRTLSPQNNGTLVSVTDRHSVPARSVGVASRCVVVAFWRKCDTLA